ncbi:MAG: citryl-CoA lyase [Candidatus Coatesbacteria bacterium]|nr:MAG: citryl-CoA lyase [Candidatus Coatesbacteria bacterium]
MSDKTWDTKITDISPNRILLRGYPIDNLMGRASYPEAFFLAITGELPDPSYVRVLDAILVSSVDHGVTPPSATAAMTVASTGSPLNAAIAAGILATSRFHGGAIEGCMNLLLDAVSRMRTGGDIEKTAADIVREYKDAKKRLPGFGHRYHTDDPRTKRLFEIAKQEGVWGQHIDMAVAIQRALVAASGKRLAINVDGAIGAVLCEMGIDPKLANAFFITSRLPGLVAHIYEEITTQKPMRRIVAADARYTGPGERHID